jgi:hypothetical protein
MSVFNRLFGKKDPQRPPLDPNQLLRAFEQFVDARTWTESQHTVEQNPVLLHPDADDLLGQLTAAQPDQQGQQVVEEHRALLRRCQEVGIEQAFAEKTGGATSDGFAVPAQFEHDWDRANDAEERYLRTADRSALDAAAGAWLRIIDNPSFAQSDQRFQLVVMNDAGGVLLRRYWSADQLADLNRALVLWQAAVQRTPPDSPDLPSRLTGLGAGLRDRYARTGALADLEEAIRVYQTAVQRTPPDSPDLPGYLNNLGAGLCDRYARTDALADLAQAIASFETAVQRTLPDSPDLPGYLNNLGTGLSDRYARTGALADLEEAIRVYQTAVQRTLPDSPDLPGYLNNLGTGLSDRYARTGALADLEEARRRYRAACQRGQEVAPEKALDSALNWGNWALERREWEEATAAYDYGRQVIDGLFAIQTSRAAKESWLKEAQGLPSNAAYALAQLGRLKETVVALEAGRARLLAEALEQNRRDLEQLEPLGHKAALDRYRTASERVTALQQQANQPATQSLRDGSQSPNQPVTRFDYTAWRQQLEQARAELDAAIAAIRQVPGYQDFFLPPSLEKIQQVATPDVPLVYLATTPVGSVALVVRAEQTLRVSANHDSPANDDSPANHNQTRRVSVVWLDGLTEAGLRAAIYGPADDSALGGYLGAYDSWRRNPRSDAARQTWHAALDQTTRWLWDALMAPVVAHLAPSRSEGEGRGEGEDSAPHATFVPTGLLSLLPLHAAWTEDPSAPTGRRYALDSVAFSYAPGARALAEAQARAAAITADGLLAVDNPDNSLVFSRQEVAAVRSYFPPDQTTVLAGANATRQAVLHQFANFPIYHLSTHGWAGWSEPLQGGLLLANGETLTLGDILDLRLAGVRLAVLSACETGIPGTKTPDEVVGLPTGLVQAGAAGVVASLWAVNDLSTAMLMERFYRLWRQDGMPPAEALRQAQIWLRDTTNEALWMHYEQDVLAGLERMPAEVAAHLAYDRMRGDPAAREFAHPIWWAAFTMTGA